MSRVRRTDAEVQAARESARIGATLGSDLQLTRMRRRITQQALGERIGLRQTRISEIEGGHGATAPLETWIALGIAVDRPLAVSFSRATSSRMSRATLATSPRRNWSSAWPGNTAAAPTSN